MSCFFRNQDWLFDPQTDPIILVLPENFFMRVLRWRSYYLNYRF